jgi:4-hydroxybenzoyl-CoA reductase subunit beta
VLTLPEYEWVSPSTVEELLRHLEKHGEESLMVAGGTDAVPNLKHRLHEPRYVVHLGGIAELLHVKDEADGLSLGARVRLSEIASSATLRRDFPSLAKAAGLVAGPQLRSMGTLGGNLCLDTRCTYYNQTFFWREALGFCLKKSGTVCHVVPTGKRCVAAHSSDVAPVLITLEAEVEIAGPGGRRTMKVDEFFVADGIHNNVLQKNEVVTRIFVPARSRGLAAGYQKLRPRQAIDFPMLSVAFAARLDAARKVESARLCVSAIAAKPRVINVDEPMRGRAHDIALAEDIGKLAHRVCHPLINVPYDQEYRREMVPVYVKRAILEAGGIPS